jgi:adenine phosphoribosyltransferase
LAIDGEPLKAKYLSLARTIYHGVSYQLFCSFPPLPPFAAVAILVPLHLLITFFSNRLDARGFVLGPPIALALKKPFIMMRKKGKMPNSISSEDYNCEYGSRSGLTVQRDRIKPGQRVLIIDDLVATGGTLSSAISLVKMLGGIPVECACVVELKMFIDPPADSGLPSRTKLFTELGHQDVPVWGLVSEDLLTNEAKLDENYVDDGEEH